MKQKGLGNNTEERKLKKRKRGWRFDSGRTKSTVPTSFATSGQLTAERRSSSMKRGNRSQATPSIVQWQSFDHSTHQFGNYPLIGRKSIKMLELSQTFSANLDKLTYSRYRSSRIVFLELRSSPGRYATGTERSMMKNAR